MAAPHIPFPAQYQQISQAGAIFIHSQLSEPMPHEPLRLAAPYCPYRQRVQGSYIKYPFSEPRLLETTKLAAGQAHMGAACGVQLKCRFSM